MWRAGGEPTPRTEDGRPKAAWFDHASAAAAPRRCGPRRERGLHGRAVYALAVTAKPPPTYILHTVALFIVLVTAMVVFLYHAWG